MTQLDLSPCTATYQATRPIVFDRVEDGPLKNAVISYHTGSFITLTPHIITEGTASVFFLGVPGAYLLTRSAFDSLRLIAPQRQENQP